MKRTINCEQHYHNIVKVNSTSVGSPQTQLVLFLTNTEARSLCINYETCDAFVALQWEKLKTFHLNSENSDQHQ